MTGNMAQGVAGLSPEQLSSMALRRTKRGRSRSIPRRTPSQYEPVSSAQQRLWFIDKLLPELPLYQVPALLRFGGGVDVDVLQQCVAELIGRHESLRTTFEDVGGVPMQRVHPAMPIDLEVVDLRNQSRAARDASWNRESSQVARRPFDLARGPLMRMALYRIADDDNVLLVVMHHIVSDAWSISILSSELNRLYEARIAGRGAGLEELPVQYADFAAWQRKLLASGEWESQVSYWTQQLADLPFSPLPGAPQRPAFPSYQGANRYFTAPGSVSAGLRAIAQREGATLFMTLLACFKVLLSRHSGETDVVVGAPVAGRTRPELEPIIGCFVNLLVLRTDLSGNPDFLRLLRRVKDVTLAAHAHQDVPFERLVEELQPDRRSMRNPLFQVAFTVQSTLSAGTLFSAASDLPEPSIGTAKFDLSLVMTETDQGLAGVWEYDKDLFDEADIDRLTAGFKTLLATIAARPSRRLSDLSLLSSEEERAMTVWNATSAENDREQCVHQLFESRARRAPDRTAVICGHKRIRYGVLNQRANCVAHTLRAAGINPGQLVGICCRLSIDLLVGLLGILKAGGAYVPIDPNYPKERVASMMAGMDGLILVSERSLEARLFDLGCQTVFVDDADPSHPSWDLPNPLSALTQDALAYGIYTSGSTGRPKLSGVRHEGLVNLLSWFIREFAIAEGDRNLVITSPSFDLTQKNLLAPLLAGAEVHLAPLEDFDPRRIVESIGEQGISLLNCTPSMFYAIADAPDHRLASLTSLRCVFLGGEPIITRRLLRLARSPHFNAEIVNTYGPTECTDVVSFYRLPDLESFTDSRVPIGTPIDNVRLFVLDENLGRVPVGAPGELCIAGLAVGAGYLNDSALTSQRFVPNPYSVESRERLFRTGDRAKYLSDGNIDFLGRADFQVKLRGFRIELGDIEATLRQHSAVKEVVVAPVGFSPAEGQLAAFVVPEPELASPLVNFLRLRREGMLADHSTHELPNGMLVVHRNRSETEFVYRELFEEHSYFRHGIELGPGATVFDVGANIGLFVLYLARYYPGTKIYAFEPIPPVFAALQLNTQAYGVDVRSFQIGLSNASGTAEFYHYPHVSILSGRYASEREDRQTVRNFLLTQRSLGDGPKLSEDNITELLQERLSSEQFTCALKTVSQVIREHSVDCIDLLKVDVEKSELDVLRGVEPEHWPLIRQVTVEVHDAGGKLEEVCRLLKQYGFEVHFEQDIILETAGMFNVYARRSENPGRVADSRKADKSAINGRDLARRRIWEGPDALKRELAEFTGTKLPDYMVPGLFVLLDGLPKTPSGKLNRSALVRIANDQLQNRAEFIPPRTTLEQKLAATWTEVLGISRIGISDNFFDLGGHSLSATQMVARVRDEFEVELPLRLIFEHPTIEDFSKILVETMLIAGDYADLGAETAQSVRGAS
jgi:amino acid adenylation domain-containing protein/FkbM family methyltransferase